jgi:hypothetical protein
MARRDRVKQLHNYVTTHNYAMIIIRQVSRQFFTFESKHANTLVSLFRVRDRNLQPLFDQLSILYQQNYIFFVSIHINDKLPLTDNFHCYMLFFSAENRLSPRSDFLEHLHAKEMHVNNFTMYQRVFSRETNVKKIIHLIDPLDWTGHRNHLQILLKILNFENNHVNKDVPRLHRMGLTDKIEPFDGYFKLYILLTHSLSGEGTLYDSQQQSLYDPRVFSLVSAFI